MYLALGAATLTGIAAGSKRFHLDSSIRGVASRI